MSEPHAETIAAAFHANYEQLAADFGYETRAESAVPWPEVPEQNRRLMIAVVEQLIAAGMIRPTDPTTIAAQRITEALARKVMAAVEASHRELYAPESYPTHDARVAWADGYTKACIDIRAAISAVEG